MTEADDKWTEEVLSSALSKEDRAMAEKALQASAKIYSLEDFLLGVARVKNKFQFEMERLVNEEKDRLRRENKPKEANYDDRFTRAWLNEKTELGKAEARIKELETALADLSKPKKKQPRKLAPNKKKPARKKKA